MFAVGGQGGKEAFDLFVLERARHSGGETEVPLAESPQAPEKPEGKIPSGYGPRSRFILQAAAHRDATYGRLTRHQLMEIGAKQRLFSLYVRYFRTKDPS